MLMRYLWGLGVGHTYAHKPSSSSNTSVSPDVTTGTENASSEEAIECAGLDVEMEPDGDSHMASLTQGEGDPCDIDDSELGLEDSEFDGWYTDEDFDGEELSNSSDDDMLVDATAVSIELDFYE
jgi:hypothetical protein